MGVTPVRVPPTVWVDEIPTVDGVPVFDIEHDNGVMYGVREDAHWRRLAKEGDSMVVASYRKCHETDPRLWPELTFYVTATWQTFETGKSRIVYTGVYQLRKNDGKIYENVVCHNDARHGEPWLFFPIFGMYESNLENNWLPIFEAISAEAEPMEPCEESVRAELTPYYWWQEWREREERKACSS